MHKTHHMLLPLGKLTEVLNHRTHILIPDKQYTRTFVFVSNVLAGNFHSIVYGVGASVLQCLRAYRRLARIRNFNHKESGELCEIRTLAKKCTSLNPFTPNPSPIKGWGFYTRRITSPPSLLAHEGALADGGRFEGAQQLVAPTRPSKRRRKLKVSQAYRAADHRAAARRPPRRSVADCHSPASRRCRRSVPAHPRSARRTWRRPQYPTRRRSTPG